MTGHAPTDPATSGRSDLRRPYLVALSVTAVGLLATVALHAAGSHTFAGLVGAVAICAWYGGVGPGVLSLLVAWPTAWLMLDKPDGPVAVPGTEELLDWLMPLVVSVVVVLASVALRRSGEQAVSRAERAESQHALTEAVQKLTEELSTALSPSDVARILVERLPKMLGSTGAALGLVDGDELRIVDPVGAPLQTLEPGLRLPLGTRAPITTAARTGEVVIAETREQFEAEFPDGARLAPTSAGALAVALRSGGRTVGAMGFPFARAGAVDEDVVSMAQLAAELGSQALERAGLYEQERTSREALDRIARLAPRFGSESPDSVTRMICLEARETFGAEAAQLWRLEGESFVVLRREPAADDVVPAGTRVAVTDFPGLRSAIERLETMFIADSLSDIHGLALAHARRLGIRSSLRVPIAVSGSTERVLVLQWTRVVPEPTPSLLVLARRFADQAGLALEHAERRVAQLEASRNADETRRLLDVTAALAVAMDSQSVAEAATREAFRGLGATAGVVVVTDGQGVLQSVSSLGFLPGELQGWERLPLDAPVPLAEAVRLGEIVAVQSAEELHERYPGLALANSRHAAWLALPLVAGGRVLGALGLSFPQERRFGDGDRSFALALSQQTGQALERAELLEVEQAARMRAERMAGDLAQLHAVTTSLGGAGHAEEITRVIAEQAADGVEAALACVFTVDEGRLTLASSTGRAEHVIELGELRDLTVDADHPLSAAVRDGEARWLAMDEDSTSTGAIDGWRAAGVSTIGVAPLLVDRVAIGALLVVFEGEHSLSDEGRRFVETVARQAAQPLDRVRLLAEERETRQAAERANVLLTGLQTVTERLAAAPTMAAVGEVMINEGRAALSGTSAFVHVESSGSEELEILASAGFRAEVRTPLDQLGPFAGPITDAFLGEAVVSIDDLAGGGPPAGSADGVLAGAVRAVLSVPLTVGGRTVGVFTVGFDTPQSFHDDDRRTATAIGRQCAQALERSRLFDEERIARNRSDRLQGLTAALSGALTPQEVVDVFLDRTAPAVGASLVAIGLLDAEGRIPRDKGWEGDVDWIPSPWLEPLGGDRTPVRDAMLRATPLYVVGTDALESRYPEIGRLPAQVERSSFAFVPLVTGGKPFALTVLVWDAEVVLDAEDRSFVETFASQCAQALDRAQRYETERTIAETLQRSVLPETLPVMEGATVAARYLPGTAAMVGGDWFDTIPLADGRLGFVVGDVVGKGVPAASTMAQLRNGMRALTLDASDPASIVTKLNRLLEGYTDAPFATMVFVTVDPRTYRVSIVSAGHLPPLVLSPDGDATFLTEGGALPLGVDPDLVYAAEECQLEPGSTIVLYTDGLVERRDRPLDEGLRLLADAVERSTASPEELVDLILEALVGDAERGDDIALLAIGLDREPLRPFAATLPADRGSLVELRTIFGQWLERAGVPDSEQRDLVLAVWEASANAIEHARDPSDPTFTVEAMLTGDTVHVEVTDNGAWCEPRERPDRGLGLDVMRSLMTSLEVAPGPGGTRVVMERTLERHRAGSEGEEWS